MRLALLAAALPLACGTDIQVVGTGPEPVPYTIVDAEIVSAGCGTVLVEAEFAGPDEGGWVNLLVDGEIVDSGYPHPGERVSFEAEYVEAGTHAIALEVSDDAGAVNDTWEETYTEAASEVWIDADALDGPIFEGDWVTAEAVVGIPTHTTQTASWTLDGSTEEMASVSDGERISWSFDAGKWGFLDLRLTVDSSCGVPTEVRWSPLVDMCDDVDGDGHRSCDGDCDDYERGVYPGVVDTCDGVDSDCDGEIDEDYATDPETAERCTDIDQDGFTAEAGDCDDRDEDTFPGAEDPADCEDSDCDGEVDEDGTVAFPYEPNDGPDAPHELVGGTRYEAFVYVGDEQDWFSVWAVDPFAKDFYVGATVTPVGPDPDLVLQLTSASDNLTWIGDEEADGSRTVHYGGDWTVDDTGEYLFGITQLSKGTCGYRMVIEVE